MPQVLQRKCACGGTPGPSGECEECRRKRLGVQRSAAGPGPDVAPPIVHDVLAGGGRPLDAGTRAFMEPRFGHSFADVRVHDDARAARSADAVHAEAYTVGRHVVFASGRYAPATGAGQSLLAHELAHVRQQGGGDPAPGPLWVNQPDGAGEREAEETERGITTGTARDLGPGLFRRHLVQRAVRERVTEDRQPHARACLVHLHGDERNALETAQTLRGSHCVNLVHLSGTQRLLNVEVPSRGRCRADPNRIFTQTGRQATLVTGPCAAASRAGAELELEQFHDTQLAPAISRCRGGSGSTSMDGPLPVVSFHNNTTPGGLAIGSYQPGGTEAGATETDPARTGGGANPTIHSSEDPDNYFLVTDPADFAGLRGTRNTVLQASSPTDDGSLSVALASARYINVEAEGKPFPGRTHAHFVTNLAMGLEVMQQLGVPQQPCAAPAADSAAAGPLSKQAVESEGAPEAGEAEPGAEPETESLLDFLSRLIDEIIRVLGQWGTMPDPLPRESPPPGLDPACLNFADQAALDTRKAVWASRISAMPPADVISWITGVATPPTVAAAEAAAQRDCMLFAIRASAGRPGSPLSLGAPAADVQSGRRSQADQERIWMGKFNFTRSTPFDRITDDARRTCGSLVGSATKWDTRDPGHRVCWGVAPRAGTTAPPMPAGARALTADERQREILQASSAPGISRHHAGTDFDLFDPDMDPAAWEAGGAFADEYSWLMRNASTYGFIQSFTAASTFMSVGYIEERWHWSYYPIAQALLEFSRSHESLLHAALLGLWGTRPEFSYIRRHWREFIYNVSERGRF
jgi:hypothetical protein